MFCQHWTLKAKVPNHLSSKLQQPHGVGYVRHDIGYLFTFIQCFLFIYLFFLHSDFSRSADQQKAAWFESDYFVNCASYIAPYTDNMDLFTSEISLM